MPRSLSGVREGEFDTIEVTEKMTTSDLETTGRFQHTANDANRPAEFSYLNIGETGDTGVRLRVFGSLEVTGATTTSGLEAALTFKDSDGTVIETYDGGEVKDFQLPTPATPSTLTFKDSNGSVLETYNGSSTKDFQLPATSTLTLQHGSTSVGTYSTADQTLTIPRTVVASLTKSDSNGVVVGESTVLLQSGFGFTLTPTATTSYLIQVQVYVDNSTANNEELTLTLTNDTESFNNHHIADTIFFGKSGKQLINYRTVLTLSSGTHEVGLAFHTEDDNDGNNVYLLFGGDYPDVVMSATIVDHTSTTYSAPAPAPSPGGGF